MLLCDYILFWYELDQVPLLRYDEMLSPDCEVVPRFTITCDMSEFVAAMRAIEVKMSAFAAACRLLQTSIKENWPDEIE